MDTNDVPDFPQLTENLTTDICIVGAGLAGLTTAYMLALKGKDVVVLDDGKILSGETERTTAHLSYALDDRYIDIERIHGEEGSKLAAASHSAAITMIEAIVLNEKIDCDFKRVDGYLFLGHDQKVELLEKELAAAHRAGLTQVERIPKAPLPDYDTGPCLRFPDQAQFHPTKYLSALAKIAAKKGVRIFTHSRVHEIEEDTQPVAVHTENGKTIKALHVIVATNAPINDNVSVYSKQAPYRTFVIGIQIPKDSIPHALYWDTLDPYHYVRVQQLDSAHDVLIVGGEDHKTGQENDMDARLKHLEQWTKTRFPKAGKTLYRWSGQVFETIDGLAMIGRRPGGKEWSYIVTGDSGMGMTHGTIAAMILSELVTGNDHPWAKLYDPSRFPLKAGVEFLKENANVGATLVCDWVKGSETDDPARIKPGSGVVIRNGVSKIALYRDDEGAFHACSAVCPHKGCIVQWNDGERSWDCPCHGSRYTANGELITGPAKEGLKPIPDWKPEGKR